MVCSLPSESAEGLLHQCRMRAAALPTEEVESKVTKIVEDLFAVAEVRLAGADMVAGVRLTCCRAYRVQCGVLGAVAMQVSWPIFV